MPRKTSVVQSEDSKIFRPEEHEVTCIDGTKVKIPRLSWEKEIDLINIIQQTLDEIASETVADTDTTVAGMVNKVLRIAPHRITQFISIVLNQSEEWCRKNLDSAEILGVIIPLLRSRLDLIMERIRPFMPEVQQQMTDTSQDIQLGQ